VIGKLGKCEFRNKILRVWGLLANIERKLTYEMSSRGELQKKLTEKGRTPL